MKYQHLHLPSTTYLIWQFTAEDARAKPNRPYPTFEMRHDTRKAGAIQKYLSKWSWQMQQTPVHEQHNPDLLRLIPITSKSIIEVGCSSGALAREFKSLSPDCHYLGIEIDSKYAELARRYCDSCLTLDIESATAEFWSENADRDCWIFGDTLEHLKDPWSILRHIRTHIPKSGSVVACIPNAQHWSIQAKLSIGDFRYQESGLLDRTHLRWFTRQTLVEMFDQAGFQIEAGLPRIFNEPGRESFLPIIEQMAKTSGVDPKIAVSDALPLQYVIRAVPK